MKNKKNILFLFFEFFRILKCVTKRECVTSRVRKDARGYCRINIFYKYQNMNYKLLKLLLDKPFKCQYN